MTVGSLRKLLMCLLRKLKDGLPQKCKVKVDEDLRLF